MNIAIYGGAFDPFTNAHLAIVARVTSIINIDHLYIEYQFKFVLPIFTRQSCNEGSHIDSAESYCKIYIFQVDFCLQNTIDCTYVNKKHVFSFYQKSSWRN